MPAVGMILRRTFIELSKSYKYNFVKTEDPFSLTPQQFVLHSFRLFQTRNGSTGSHQLVQDFGEVS